MDTTAASTASVIARVAAVEGGSGGGGGGEGGRGGARGAEGEEGGLGQGSKSPVLENETAVRVLSKPPHSPALSSRSRPVLLKLCSALHSLGNGPTNRLLFKRRCSKAVRVLSCGGKVEEMLFELKSRSCSCVRVLNCSMTDPESMLLLRSKDVKSTSGAISKGRRPTI